MSCLYTHSLPQSKKLTFYVSIRTMLLLVLPSPPLSLFPHFLVERICYGPVPLFRLHFLLEIEVLKMSCRALDPALISKE